MQLVLSEMMFLLISLYHIQLLSYSFIDSTFNGLKQLCYSVFGINKCACVVVLGALLKCLTLFHFASG